MYGSSVWVLIQALFAGLVRRFVFVFRHCLQVLFIVLVCVQALFAGLVHWFGFVFRHVCKLGISVLELFLPYSCKEHCRYRDCRKQTDTYPNRHDELSFNATGAL